jgi:hypothetical protein
MLLKFKFFKIKFEQKKKRRITRRLFAHSTKEKVPQSMFALSIVALAAAISGVVGGGFSLTTYSSVMTGMYGTAKSTVTVSMVPDGTTGDLQPIIAMNTTRNILIGGTRSFVGGVATLPYYNAPGDRRLDLFDFSRGGWPSKKSTVVGKSGSITTYTSNCTVSTGCSYVSSGALVWFSAYIGATVTLSVDSRQNIPLYINISSPSSYNISWSFDLFDSDASTFQPDDSVYSLPANFYPPSSVPSPTPNPTKPNVTTISFYRSFTNDSFSRNLANDNAASPAGEANWICPAPRAGLIIAQFDVTVDANFGQYAMCNKGACACGMLTTCQRVGRQTNSIATNLWYSFPQSAMCAKGFPIGTNNCTWQEDYKLVTAITADCFNTIKGDPLFPNGYTRVCTNYDTVGAHLLYSLQNCPDVKDSLPWPFEW